MSQLRGLLLSGVLSVAMLLSAIPAAAENYMGDYAWLRFWNATITTTDTYYNGWERISWLSAPGNTGDRWYQLSWTESMNLTSTRVQAWQQLGVGGSLGDYKLQYSVNGVDGWKDIDLAEIRYANGQLASGLSGTDDYIVTFANMPAGGVKALRVFFPEDNYVYTNGHSGPGVSKFLPTGNLASGQGLNPADPCFNVFGTDWKNNPNAFLGINPTIWTDGRALSEGSGSLGRLTDCYLDADWARIGWHPNGTPEKMDGTETIIIDLGTLLSIHGVTLYGGTHMNYLVQTIDVYITDDLDEWGVGSTVTLTGGLLSWSSPEGLIGQYVILTNPTLPTFGENKDYFLIQEIAINARAIPEPATMSLLVLAGLAMLRRRK